VDDGAVHFPRLESAIDHDWNWRTSFYLIDNYRVSALQGKASGQGGVSYSRFLKRL